MVDRAVKILCTGSRAWKDTIFSRAFIRGSLLGATEGASLPIIIIHGGARGADALVDEAARKFGWEVRPYPVDEAKDGPWPEAGGNRNSRMLKEEHHPERQDPIDLCLAFPLPESKGTWNMVNLCDQAKIRVRVCG
jgi:hypothetical protein